MLDVSLCLATTMLVGLYVSSVLQVVPYVQIHRIALPVPPITIYGLTTYVTLPVFLATFPTQLL